MERYIIFAFLLLACISCRPKQQECQLNDQFICFAETGEKGEILKGVRRIADGQILIQPGSYLSVAADSCFIVAQKGTVNRYHAPICHSLILLEFSIRYMPNIDIVYPLQFSIS